MNLPNVYQNKNIGFINNDQEIYYSNNNNMINNNESPFYNKMDIDTKINYLFKSKNYVYKLNVIITTNDNTIDTAIIGKSNNNLITINNDLIPINKIIDIKEK